MKHILTTLLALTIMATTPALALEINNQHSTVTFEGTHAGTPFKGHFEEWSGQVNLTENNGIQATFHTNSAQTGNPMYDGTLPTVDWFDSKNHPKATFQSTKIEEVSTNTFEVTGELTIKGISKDITFDLTTEDLPDGHIKGQTTFTINRLDYAIGKKSDPSGEWVGLEIPVTLKFTTKP